MNTTVTPTFFDEVITVQQGTLDTSVIMRVWKDLSTPASQGGILSDVRLSEAQAFTLAEAILRAIDPSLTIDPARAAAYFSRRAEAIISNTTNA